MTDIRNLLNDDTDAFDGLKLDWDEFNLVMDGIINNI